MRTAKFIHLKFLQHPLQPLVFVLFQGCYRGSIVGDLKPSAVFDLNRGDEQTLNVTQKL